MSDDATTSMPVVRVARKPASTQPKKLPPYHVVLLDDDHHSYDYVILMLRSLFGHSEQKADSMAVELDTVGRVIVYTTTKEHAELKRDQIHAFGKDLSNVVCKGSMSAVIEPAE